ncbi:hypothetical protein, partial [Caballeronia udeis]|uniref:hypothetical protein n=1 Tax=Caballeronia udeis TaxID=1232866 RepID=UPI0012E77A59
MSDLHDDACLPLVEQDRSTAADYCGVEWWMGASKKQPFRNIARMAVSVNANPESNHVQINVFIDRHCFERCLIQRYRED